MNRKFVLFDLDGTITDPKVGITRSVDHALQNFGIRTENLDDLTKFIGPPLKNSFMEFFGFSEEKAEAAIDSYREYFVQKGIFENYVYSGIPQMLEKLRQNGKTIIMATSKPQEFAETILEHFNLTQYFDDVCGADLKGNRSEKCDVIAYVIKKCGIENVKNAIMVGDRKHDIIGAHKNNMDCIGVLYGYGSLPELEQAGADFIATDIESLGNILTD